MRRYTRGFVVGLACLAGCATKPTQARRDVSKMIEARAGIKDGVSPEQDEEALARVRARVDSLLAKPLSVDAAVVVALLNNPRLQATFEDLGVAQAELVQAGLLDNPVIGGDLVFSTLGNGLGGGFSVSQSLLGAFLIPAKRRLAKARLQHAIVEVGQTVLVLVHDVKVAWFHLQASNARLARQREILKAAEVADELSQRQSDVGNTSELDRAEVAAVLDRARLDHVEAQLEFARARESLTQLLGVWGRTAEFTLAGQLPDLPASEPELGELESWGMRERLDISAARFNVNAMEYALALRRRGVVPQIDAGVEARNEVGNDTGHEWVIGPSLSIELPIFDPGHAEFAELRAELRRSQFLLQDASVMARSEIRLARETLELERGRAEYYRDVVLPRHETLTRESLERYNGMLLGAFDLFHVRREEFSAQAEYAEALQAYWRARADLELAIGGKLPAGGAPRANPP